MFNLLDPMKVGLVLQFRRIKSTKTRATAVCIKLVKFMRVSRNCLMLNAYTLQGSQEVLLKESKTFLFP